MNTYPQINTAKKDAKQKSLLPYSLCELISNNEGINALTPLIVGRLVREALSSQSMGQTYGKKAVLQPTDNELYPLIGTNELDERFKLERLNWKLNALISANEKYCAVKLVGSNAWNRTVNLPRSRSLIILYNKLTMQPLTILDGTNISNMRTGAYASIVADYALKSQKNFSVFLLGAGCVAEKIIEDLNVFHGQKISILYVKSRSQESAQQFSQHMESNTVFPIIPVTDFSKMKDCDLVITASNAKQPAYHDFHLKDNATVLHLGGDETPECFINRAINTGQVLCDDVEMVCHRASQSLSLFFANKGLTLSTEAKKLRIENLWDEIKKGTNRKPGHPLFVTCVGLPMLDLYIAKWVYEKSGESGLQVNHHD